MADAFLATAFEGGRHEARVCKASGSRIEQTDPAIYAAITAEEHRQRNNIELIASENFTSPAVMEAQGSVLTNKYAEGYPGKRWYGGCENVDVVEQLAIDRAKQLFGAEHANVQPHSGSQANTAVYFSVLKPGDKILTMDLAHGGHLTHGHKANFSGRFYDVTHYGVSPNDERIDYDELEKTARELKPALITVGASAYPRIIDFERMGKLAREIGAYLFVDMAHIAGLVAAGLHPSPVPHADFVTSTTHKSLRGPRGGIILCKEEFAKKIDSQVFPGIQGGPLMHVIAAKAVCFGEALKPEFKEYSAQIVKNAQAIAARLAQHGFRIVSGGTDNHLMLVDLRPKGLNGARRLARPRPSRHHREQERHPLRHRQPDETQRHPHRHARRHHPRHEGSRCRTGRRFHPRSLVGSHQHREAPRAPRAGLRLQPRLPAAVVKC